ncbi:MAG: right-handed parallel beta-helix repeat-containing protein, partial [Planctomycetaceae bacterium]|nr:right-handed parallel beta-helix repeat-containing protein [Planctomycetaceae bacterium]
GGGTGFELAVAVGNGVSSPVTEANGWKVVGATSPHAEIALNGSISVTAFYADTSDLNTTIAGNYIGTNAAGTAGIPNTLDGVRIAFAAHGVTVGGASIAERNVISANGNDGIEINGGNTWTGDNRVMGNYIGLTADGTAMLGNFRNGITMVQSSDNLIGTDGNGINDSLERNVVAGNGAGASTDANININGLNANNNIIAGNYVGTAADGITALPNPARGVRVNQGTGNRIGTDGSDDANNINERNVIVGHATLGVAVFNAFDTVIAGNYIGLTADGTTPAGNGGVGITVSNSAATRIGTDANGFADELEGNVVVGNASNGIQISTTQGSPSTIAGNLVGVSPTGAAMANLGNGIQLGNNSANVVVGGTQASQRNIVQHNAGNGLYATGTISGNWITGNTITLNQLNGILLENAAGNIIGTNGDGLNDLFEGNLISGNVIDGIQITGSGSTGNRVAGNWIGLAANGIDAFPNLRHGISISGGASGNIIGTNSDLSSDGSEGNVISGNQVDGVFITGVDTTDNVVAGNLIGTDTDGNTALPNGSNGVVIEQGATRNLIGSNADGTADAEEANVISGNLGYGIALRNSGTEDNVVAGNFIGTNRAGDSAVANDESGVIIHDGAANNLIGGSVAAAMNVISGNLALGVFITGAAMNRLLGNYIGTDKSGRNALGNQASGIRIDAGSTNNTIGGSGPGDGNVISANAFNGVIIDGLTTTGNVISGNRVGLASDGITDLGNGHQGIFLINDTSGNIIGGTSTGAGNTVSGNALSGILISEGANHNSVQGNRIGTDVTGTVAVSNDISGVFVSFGAFENTIGGTQPGAGNVLSGNTFSGVWVTDSAHDNDIVGNLIGTDLTGTLSVPNGTSGVVLTDGAYGNTVGGIDAASRNIIAGNLSHGVHVFGTGTDDNVVTGNYIGTDVSGSAALGNGGDGIRIESGTAGTTIGGAVAGAGNVISGNSANGINLIAAGAGTLIQGNRIGVTRSGGSLGNLAAGIQTNSPVVIGIEPGNAVLDGQDNVISHNATAGVSTTSTGVSVRGNSLHSNGGLAVDYNDDGVTFNNTGLQNFPIAATILGGATTRAIGSLSAAASTSYLIDVYADGTPDESGYGEGRRYLGSASATTDAAGNVSFDIEVPGYTVLGEFVSLTATAPDGTTSEFSAATGVIFDQPPAIDSGNLLFTVLEDANNLGADFGIPDTSLPEGQLIRLDGLFSNPDPNDVHTVHIDWGDGTTDTQTVSAGERGFSGDHIYQDDDPTSTDSDPYSVIVTVTDDDGASGQVLLSIVVANVAPHDVQLRLSTDQAVEGDVVTLEGSFSDPSLADRHQVIIDWADGSGPQTLSLPVGARSFALSHQFIDDVATSDITVTIADDDSGLTVVTTPITVTNAAPQPSIVGLPATTLEGTTLSMSVAVADPGIADTHTYLWTVQNGLGVVATCQGPDLSFTPTDDGVYQFAVSVTDDDGLTGTSQSTSTVVANVAPSIEPGNLTFRNAQGILVPGIPEGQLLTLEGSFTDPG